MRLKRPNSNRFLRMQAFADAAPLQAAPDEAAISMRALLWLVIALTLASVLLLGHEFGGGNHAEQLPPVLRARPELSTQRLGCQRQSRLQSPLGLTPV